MNKITNDPAMSNSQKTEAMEKLLLEEGQKAGVVAMKQFKPSLNPNRIGKVLAPWFNEECRESKK